MISQHRNEVLKCNFFTFLGHMKLGFTTISWRFMDTGTLKLQLVLLPDQSPYNYIVCLHNAEILKYNTATYVAVVN